MPAIADVKFAARAVARFPLTLRICGSSAALGEQNIVTGFIVRRLLPFGRYRSEAAAAERKQHGFGAMKPKPTYVILATCGTGWEANGPIASEYRSLKEAEAAASALSLRYPHKTLGVYELRSVLGTQQKVVKQRVGGADDEAPKAKPAPQPLRESANVLKIRA